MNVPPLSIVFLGLSITSSWGNGHATTYRGLVRELCARGHRVLFLERDMPWYAENLDLPEPPYGTTILYRNLEDLELRFGSEVARADVVVVGSYVPQGVEVGWWAMSLAPGRCFFYDIDTPVTLAKIARGDFEYLSPDQIPKYRRYLSFTGGPTLEILERRYGAPKALPLYCSFDPDLYFPASPVSTWDLGYMGTYSTDRQPPLERLMLDAARAWPNGRFVVGGPQYPPQLNWPENVDRIEHLTPEKHRGFYCSQRFTLNITRSDMVKAGWSPSVRLFEASACATPVISDWWEGLDTFFRPGSEILISNSGEETVAYLRDLSDEERSALGEKARSRVLAEHTAAHRAIQFEAYAMDVLRQPEDAAA